jgi:uncharacterized protein YigA (DUF484 family)
MNDEVRKALYCLERNDISWHTVNNELTRLTEVADAVDPIVIRLHDVTAKLEAANALLREIHRSCVLTCDLWTRTAAHLLESPHELP